MHSQASRNTENTDLCSGPLTHTKRRSVQAFPRMIGIAGVALAAVLWGGFAVGQESGKASTCPPQFASCLTEAEARHNLKLLAELESLRTQVKILRGGSFLKRHFSLGAAVGPTAVFCQDVGEGSACVGVTVGISIH